MKLLIVSHTAHVNHQGNWYGWGPTVREINFLSNYFEITHIAPAESSSNLPQSYDRVNPSVKIVSTRNRGGVGFVSKLKVLLDSFRYAELVIRNSFSSDIVHVRCPANISLVALVVLIFFPDKKKWIKYAGDWRPIKDYGSYKLQRFIIRHLFYNHVVSVNGSYAGEKLFIHHILNPSYSREELPSTIESKSLRSDEVVVLFVGGLTSNKGVDIVIRATSLIKDFTPKIKVHIIGEGPERGNLVSLTSSLGLASQVFFEGWKTKDELKMFYRSAHFIILPSTGEGWPKVISEAMSFGVVPIVSDVSGIRQNLEKIGTGSIVKNFDPVFYAEAMKQYLQSPELWSSQSNMGIKKADLFTFENWIENLFELFERQWKLKFSSRDKSI